MCHYCIYLLEDIKKKLATALIWKMYVRNKPRSQNLNFSSKFHFDASMDNVRLKQHKLVHVSANNNRYSNGDHFSLVMWNI